MAFSDTQRQYEHIEQYTEFLERYYKEELGELAQHYPQEQQSLTVTWSDLYQYDMELAESFREEPEGHTDMLENAITEVTLPVDISLDGATVRVHVPPNGSMTYSVGETRAAHCGTYLGLYGHIKKASAVQPKLIEGVWDCQRCGARTTVPQTGGDLEMPHQCAGCERDGPFRQIKGASTYIDHQLLRLQQPPEEVAGGQGRHIDVHIEGIDLVDELQAGDRVTLSGIYELEALDGDVIADTFLSGRAARVEQTDYEDIEVGAYKERIERLASGAEGDPFELLMASLAPKIHGHASLKLAIILQLFGGSRVEYPTGEVDRGDSHILLLGDPGTAKSKLLRAVEELSPRSAYASGKGASAAGLTAAAVSDDFADTQWSLEAGALALANKGAACLDEIDKIDGEAVSSLHDALESQRIVVNKAGINTTLPAQTAVLAAGNPKHGRFDDHTAIAAQVDIEPSLLSRFDLMFMLKDTPATDRDTTIASHVIDYRQDGIEAHATDTDDEKFTVPVEAECFRAWIAHAKRSVRPSITDDSVRENLASSFVHFRQINGEENDAPVPVTFRKLEGIQRLAEASARVRLSETVEKEDVDRARELVGQSLKDVGMDPDTGEFDVDVVETGVSRSQHERIQLLEEIVLEQEIDGDGQSGAPIEAVVELAVAAGVSESKARATIEKLRTEGHLYSVADGEVRKVRD